MQENWKPAAGYAGRYEVSDQGRVKRLARTVTYSDGRRRHYPEQIMTGRTDRDGYRRVRLTNPAGDVADQAVHRLVLDAFTGPCPDGMEACHGDGNPANNNASNLRWGTRAENVRDQVRHGTHSEASKETCPRAHRLTAPNLVAHEQRQGRRNCLACHRAASRVGNFRRRYGIEIHPVTRDNDAMLRYWWIMANHDQEAAA